MLDKPNIAEIWRKAAVFLGEREKEGRAAGVWRVGQRYISGSFCVSMTAAMGMPKFETGPQKSVERENVSG